jgi:di/tricarboxylate transporter
MTDLLVVLTLLGAAIVMFAINKPRLDAVALVMLVALPFTGILTMGEALAGFSDSNIFLIAALFVLGEGLIRTGVAHRLGDWLIAKAGKSEVRLIVLLMVVVGALGATMSSTAVTAIFIPSPRAPASVRAGGQKRNPSPRLPWKPGERSSSMPSGVDDLIKLELSLGRHRATAGI